MSIISKQLSNHRWRSCIGYQSSRWSRTNSLCSFTYSYPPGTAIFVWPSLQSPQPTADIGWGQLILQTISCQGQELNLANAISATLVRLSGTVFRLICMISLTLTHLKMARECTFWSCVFVTFVRHSWTSRTAVEWRPVFFYKSFICIRRLNY